MIYLCRVANNMSILPVAGGLLDQDFVFVKALGIVAYTDAEKARLEARKTK